MGYRPIDPALRRKAVCSVLDEDRPVLSVCEMYGIGPTALRRWVEQERQRRALPPVTAAQVAGYEAELAALRARVADLEQEQLVLKKQLPSHLDRLLGRQRTSSKQ